MRNFTLLAWCYAGKRKDHKQDPGNEGKDVPKVRSLVGGAPPAAVLCSPAGGNEHIIFMATFILKM